MQSAVSKLIFGLIILFVHGATMADALNPSSSSSTSSSSPSSSSTGTSHGRRKLLACENTFKHPSPLPDWPPGGGFASGTVDLGGLQVSQVSSFNKIWATHEGGPENLGATFYDPDSIPEGFSILGSYSQPNNMPLYGHVLVGKDVTVNNPSNGTLKPPIGYTLVWSSESLDIKKDGDGYFWLPTPPEGYAATGYVVTTLPEKPPPNKTRCVRSDLADTLEVDTWVWGVNGFNVYTSRPANRGVEAMGASIGGFVVVTEGGHNASSLSCLKNVNGDLLSMMPSLSQINALIQAYSPVVYFHRDEPYLPSSVDWFFQNGALLYHKGEESKPTRVENDGTNLPQGGSNDQTYWLDLPVDVASKDRVKRGDIQSAGAYFHVKPMYGGLFTYIAIWVFYPFSGAARAQIGLINIPLGTIGNHVGDWEHITLRISNFNGELISVFFSEHSKGTWVSASVLEYANGNKPVVYASLHGHAFYSRPGCLLVGPLGINIGLRQDMSKSNKVMDTGVKPMVVAAEYLGSAVLEPSWLNYTRKWGPTIDYDINHILVWKLKKAFKKFLNSVTHAVLREDGPTGPKVKNNWKGDEAA